MASIAAVVAASATARKAKSPAPEVVENIAIIDKQVWLRAMIRNSHWLLGFARCSSHDN
jgi:hypothetical protein